MILGVTGYVAAGKDTVAEYLINKGFHHYSLSDELRSILKERQLEINRDNLVRVGNELRQQYGADYLAKRVIRKLIEPAVVTSIRTPAEAKVLKTAGAKLIFIDAPLELRFKRIQERCREGEGGLSLAEFKRQEDREKGTAEHQQQLHAVAAVADCIIINDGSLDELYTKVNSVVKEVGYGPQEKNRRPSAA